jgi:hypothetical protein
LAAFQTVGSPLEIVAFRDIIALHVVGADLRVLVGAGDDNDR